MRDRSAAIERKTKQDKYQVLEQALQAGPKEHVEKIVADWKSAGQEELALAFECALNANLVKSAIYLYPLVPDDAYLVSESGCYPYHAGNFYHYEYPLCIAASHGYLDLVNYFISQSADTSFAAGSAIVIGLTGRGNEWMIQQMIQSLIEEWPMQEEHATMVLQKAVMDNRSALVVWLAREYRLSDSSIADLVDYALRMKRSPEICHALVSCKARISYPFLDGNLAVCLCIVIWLIRQKIKIVARYLGKYLNKAITLPSTC